MKNLFHKIFDKMRFHLRPLSFLSLRARKYNPSRINGHINYVFFKSLFKSNGWFIKCNLLGQAIELNEISWNFDYMSEFKFKEEAFYKIKASEYFFRGVDIKNAWEIGRLPFLIPLAISANERNDPSLYSGVVMSWIRNSRFLYGVNWLCAMDVAIRMSNLAVSYRLLNSEIKSEFLENKISVELKKSCRFVMSQLEKKSDGFVWNHTTANYCGLFIVACLMPEWPDSSKITKFAKNGLEYCIRKQTYADGTNFEASSFYHKLGIELFAYPLLMGKENSIEFSDCYKQILKSQFYYIFTLRNSEKIVPQLGDNDSGRLFYDFKEEESDTRYLDNLYLEIFSENWYEISNKFLNKKIIDFHTNSVLKGLWNFGLEFTYFMVSKVIVVKNENYHFVTYCFPSGSGGKGGHNHQDVGAYVLSVGKRYQVTDPGTFTYTRSKNDRDSFRSCSSHNVVVPKDSDFDLTSMPVFRLDKFLTIENIVVNENELILNLFCEKSNVKIIRKFSFLRNRVIVNDSSRSEIVSYLNIDMIEIFDSNLMLHGIENDQIRINIKCRKLMERKSNYSPGYGIKRPIKHVCVYSKLKQKHFCNEVEYSVK